MVRTFLAGGLLIAAIVALADALVTRDGVGPVEYVVGAALLTLLLVMLFRVSRRVVQRA